MRHRFGVLIFAGFTMAACVSDDAGGPEASPPPAAVVSVGPDYPVLNVVDFGADGSDEEDDTDAIREAIREAEKTGKRTVYFPTGIYRVAPREDDPQWRTPQPYVFAVDGSDIVFKGDGPDRSEILFYTLEMRDPERNWTVTDDRTGYFTIKRGGLFRLGPSGRPVRNIQFRSLRLNGNCGRSGSSKVGGDPRTGAGRDNSHKAISTFKDAKDILIENCTLDRWRGEIVYGGGYRVDRTRIINSRIADCDGSAISTAGCVIENSEIENCYNGIENVGFHKRPTTITGSGFRECGNAVVYIGDRTGALKVEKCVITDCQRGFFFANLAHHVYLRENTVRDVESMVFVIDHRAYLKERVGHEGFSDFFIENNSVSSPDRGGKTVIYWQLHRGVPLINWWITKNKVGKGRWQSFIHEYFGGPGHVLRSVVVHENELPEGMEGYRLDPLSTGSPPGPLVQ